MLKPDISFSDFEKISLRVGTIISAKPNKEARLPAYILEVDFGELGVKKSSAQITKYYTPESLIGKQIVAVCNLPPRQVARTMSEVLILGAIEEDDESIVLLQTDRKVTNGLSVG